MYDIIVFMISYIILKYHICCHSFFIYDICYDIIYDICSFAAADPAPAQRADDRDADLDRPMDADDARDYADQDPPSDMDMEEDAEILATLLKHIPSCMSADDIQQLLQDLPVQPPVVVPIRTVTNSAGGYSGWRTSSSRCGCS